MSAELTKESQNQTQIDYYREHGPAQMGPWTSHIWRNDPRHLGFLLARYKFCAKMLAGKGAVLDIGCGDAFGMPVILQTVGSIHGVDFEPLVLEEAERQVEQATNGRCSFSVADLTEGPVDGVFDAAYSLDVIEHIPPDLEHQFLANVVSSLKSDAVCIFGTPNIAGEAYASAGSQEGHVNLKSSDTLCESLSAHFSNVFMFSMNDELVHTGFSPMAHYLLGIGVGLKR